MDLLAAENAIIARIQAQLSIQFAADFNSPDVLSFPQNPIQHFESIHPNGEILIAFAGLSPTDPEPNRDKEIIQEFAIDWSIWIVHRDLTEHGGVYTMVDFLLNALNGWTLSYTSGQSTVTWNDSTPFYLTDTSFQDEIGGVWFYEMVFRHVLEEK